MKSKLSLLTITKNAQGLIEKTLESVKGLVDEIIIIDNCSTDKTVEIAKKYGAKVYLHHEEDLGKQKRYGLGKCKGEWVLVLDADEYLSESLRKEIKELFVIRYSLLGKYDGFYIPFQNHFLSQSIKYGGENYKMLRLFKKNAVYINPALVHERFEINKGKVGKLRGKIYHHSYRSLWQTYKKFTDYAIREAKQKFNNGEKSSLKKIFLYPLHMFWARFVEDRGYKDGLFRIPLDLGFAYMEFLTYIFLWWYGIKNSKFKNQNAK